MPDESFDSLRGHLETLHISSLPEWDVLAFIHSHGPNLGSAADIARLLGYDKTTVGTALDFLTSAELIQRSRNSRGARLFRLTSTPQDAARSLALQEIIKTVGDRKGRLLLIRCLRHAATRKERQHRGSLHLA
jgi:DNA-binding MarR family transcriptional regulator